MGRKPAKAYHHGDLRDALVRAGRTILEEEGPEALTLRACARRAGVSHAAPQHHFTSVTDLLAEIAATGFEDFVIALEDAAAGADSPVARLKAMALGYVAFAEARPAVYQLMFGVRSGVENARLQRAMAAAWDQLSSCVAQAAGPAHADAHSAHVWSLVHGVSMLRLARRFPPIVDADAALDVMIDSLPRAIGAEP